MFFDRTRSYHEKLKFDNPEMVLFAWGAAVLECVLVERQEKLAAVLQGRPPSDRLLLENTHLKKPYDTHLEMIRSNATKKGDTWMVGIWSNFLAWGTDSSQETGLPSDKLPANCYMSDDDV